MKCMDSTPYFLVERVLKVEYSRVYVSLLVH
uniref:Uncharacterized protein n=1 Tax=Anguilla anguilla TaxID=7936 RepID=A0A0E9V756_ANGAN